MALVFIPDDVARRSIVEVLAEHLPLALAEALRQDLFRDNEALEELIITKLMDVLIGYPNAAEKFAAGQRRAIIYKLTDPSPEVFEKFHFESHCASFK